MKFPTYFDRNLFIRDAQGYLCRFCKRRVYKYTWKKTTLKDALYSHNQRCAARYDLSFPKMEVKFIER